MKRTTLQNQGIRIAKGDGWIFVVLLLGIAAIGEALKLMRAPALLLIVLVAVIYAREAMFRKQQIPLLLFSLWGLIYVALSFVNAFPVAWTRYYDSGVILQQASYLATLLPLVAASQKWWDDPRFDTNRDSVLIAAVLAAFVFGAAIDVGIGVYNDIRPFASMRNYVFIGLLALSYLAFRQGKWRRPAILALLLLAAAAIWRHQFLQTTIIYLLLIMFLTITVIRIRADRMMLILFLLLLAAATVYGLQDPLRVFQIDENTGLRLAWWNDALAATAQTGGVGVGFGTEALRNEYATTLERDSYREEGGAFLLISTHSAFFDTLFRTGAVGFLLLCFALWRCFPHPRIPPQARAHCCAMFAVLIICLHSNLGLQSPMHALGVAICIGYLQSERRKIYVSASIAAKGELANARPYAVSLGGL
jgi:O-antigen ligase